ncbi:MAG TPA: MFS transporter [Xanthobacteraceae bacterium]|nr:MFS transporter [Xanthobacteraceae bacterium]
MNVLSRIKTTAPSARTGIYHGWLVVGAAFLIAFFGWGIGFYGPGIYLVALQQRHGWPTADISSAITTYYLLGATLIIFVGGVFERLGARHTVSAGVTAMACGAVLLTLVSRPWHVYAAFAVMSCGWAAMSGAAINVIIAPWFDKRRGLAISLALNGASLGGVVIAPLLIFLIGRLNFAVALSGVAALMLAIILPTAAFVLRHKRRNEHDAADEGSDSTQTQTSVPATAAQALPWQLSAVLRSWDFQTVSISFALGLMMQVGFLTHQVAYLSPILGPTATAWAVSLTTSSAVVGRLLIGLFVDKLDRRVVACGNFLVQSAGTALLAANLSALMLYLGCTLFGLGLGNLISLPGLIVQQEFPQQHFSRIVGLIVAINQFAFAFGPGLLGHLQQAHGDYTGALMACVIVEVTAAVMVIFPRLWPFLRSNAGKK